MVRRVWENDAPDLTHTRAPISLISLDTDAPSGSVRGNVSISEQDNQRPPTMVCLILILYIQCVCFLFTRLIFNICHMCPSFKLPRVKESVWP